MSSSICHLREQTQGSYRPAPSLQDEEAVHKRQALGDGRVQAAHRQETRSLQLQLGVIPVSAEQDQPDTQTPAEELYTSPARSVARLAAARPDGGVSGR